MTDKSRLHPGDAVPPWQRPSLAHGTIHVPNPKSIVHLQFRRFAGCPICSLHLRTFAGRIADIEAAGVHEVAVFHASADELAGYQQQLPFAVVPDPKRELYREYGVERGARAVLHPRAMVAGLRGMLEGSVNPLRMGGGVTGLPADFLIAPDGRLLAVKYGEHADDHWEVDGLLEQVGGHSPAPAPA